MKRITTTLLALVLLSVAAFAQENHLKFKGIPIDGNISEFMKSLNKQGYITTYTSEEGNAAIMDGRFTGQDVSLFILATSRAKTVWKVAVAFEDQSSWYSLKSDYMTLKENLARKYGTPDQCYEFFSSPYEEGDGYEMTAIYADKCFYVSVFSVTDDAGNKIGSVSVDISKSGTQGFVRLSYEDAVNEAIRDSEKQEMYIDEL